MLSVFVSGCGDYSIDLPNGYRIERTNASTIMIFGSSGVKQESNRYRFVVPPKITAIGCSVDIVYGIIEESPKADIVGETIPGYFILNTGTGDIKLGLNEIDFRFELKSLGIKDMPPLTRNIRWFKPTIKTPDPS